VQNEALEDLLVFLDNYWLIALSLKMLNLRYGVTFEINGTKLGKIKYNRSHRVDGVLVVLGNEFTKPKKIEV
jgi:hypothetical protein